MGSECSLLPSRCSSCGGTVEHQRGRRNQQRVDHHLDGRSDFPAGGESRESGRSAGSRHSSQENARGSLGELSKSTKEQTKRAGCDRTEITLAFSA